MDQGEIIEYNTPQNIFDNPTENRTANFVSKILK